MSDARGVTLLRLARAAIEAVFDGGRVAMPPEPWLSEYRATFVTLRRRPDGELRGCVGSVEAWRPLGEDVIASAQGAARRDARFEPVTRDELDRVRIEVSVLSPLAPLPVVSEADACAKIEGSRPGLVLICGDRRGVFLPKVWESFPDASEFLQHLRLKAGLPGRSWSGEILLQTFTCDEYAEPGDVAPGDEPS